MSLNIPFESLLRMFSDNTSLIIFFGILVFGIPVILSVVFAAANGFLNIWTVSFLAIFATMISDFLWYIAGYLFQKSSYIEKKIQKIQWMTDQFDRHSFKLIFISRFIYGTKSAANMLGGIRRLDLRKFMAANFISYAVWFSIVASLAFILHDLIQLENTAENIKFGITALFIIVGLFYVVLGKYAKKKLRVQENNKIGD